MPPILNLKKQRPAGQCAAMRCKEPSFGVTDLGETPDLRGVGLCPRHLRHVAGESVERMNAPPPPTAPLEASDPALDWTRTQETPVEVSPAALARVAEIVPTTPAPAEQPERTELVTLQTELTDVLAMVKAFEVRTPDDVQFAKDAIENAAEQRKELEAKLKRATKPFNEGLKEVRSWFAPAVATLTEIDGILKAKLLLAQQAAAAEQARLADEARAAAAQGDMPAVRQALVAASDSTVDLQGMAKIEKWGFEVTDLSLLPEEFWKRVPDMDKIGAIVGEFKAATNIPGVKVCDLSYLRRTGR